MKLVEQVVSLARAKELKGLGANQDSLWIWTKASCVDRVYECRLSWNCDPHLENYSAYTVAEVGEMLPGEIREKIGNARTNPYFLDCGKIYSEDVYYVRYTIHVTGDTICMVYEKKEADARAEMLIYLYKMSDHLVVWK